MFTWNQNLENETQRFQMTTLATQRLRAPDTKAILDLPRVAFQIWPEEDLSASQTLFEEQEFTEELLHIELPNSPPGTQHRLMVFRAAKSQLRIIDSTRQITRQTTKNTIQKYNVDLDRVQLIPLYASPQATPDAFNLNFNAEGNAGGFVSISFDRLGTLLRFQHALTGYEVVFDKRYVKTEYYTLTVFSSQKSAEEGGFQLWIPKKTRTERASAGRRHDCQYGVPAKLSYHHKKPWTVFGQSFLGLSSEQPAFAPYTLGNKPRHDIRDRKWWQWLPSRKTQTFNAGYIHGSAQRKTWIPSREDRHDDIYQQRFL